MCKRQEIAEALKVVGCRMVTGQDWFATSHWFLKFLSSLLCLLVESDGLFHQEFFNTSCTLKDGCEIRRKKWFVCQLESWYFDPGLRNVHVEVSIGQLCGSHVALICWQLFEMISKTRKLLLRCFRNRDYVAVTLFWVYKKYFNSKWKATLKSINLSIGFTRLSFQGLWLVPKVIQSKECYHPLVLLHIPSHCNHTLLRSFYVTDQNKTTLKCEEGRKGHMVFIWILPSVLTSWPPIPAIPWCITTKFYI